MIVFVANLRFKYKYLALAIINQKVKRKKRIYVNYSIIRSRIKQWRKE
jgi:hypothetical protein